MNFFVNPFFICCPCEALFYFSTFSSTFFFSTSLSSLLTLLTGLGANRSSNTFKICFDFLSCSYFSVNSLKSSLIFSAFCINLAAKSPVALLLGPPILFFSFRLAKVSNLTVSLTLGFSFYFPSYFR